MNKFLVATSILLATTALAGAPVRAADTAADLARQLQALQEQVRQMQEKLKANEEATKEALAKETAAREASEKMVREYAIESGANVVFAEGQRKLVVGSNPKVVQSGTNRFTLSSADNAWTIAPTGRIHFDFGGYLSQRPEGTTGPGTVAGGRLTGGVNVRRARLGVAGRAMNDFTYELILDAGGATDGTAAINTAKIGYTGIRNTIIEAGYMANLFVLEEASSSNDILFIERSSPSTLATSFTAGDPRAAAGIRTWESNYFLAAYMTFSTPNTPHAQTRRSLGAYQRATYNIINEPLKTLHVGVSAAQIFDVPNTGPNTASSITLSERPELRVDPTNLLNTGALGTLANPVTGANVYNVETAATLGSFFYQGEYFKMTFDRRGKTKAKFDTGYAQVSYTFGGRRNYSANCGCYGGVNPVAPFSPIKGDMGAFEIAARVSVADLTDQYDPTLLITSPANFNFVNGGKQTNYTLGLNWYWNSNMLWKFNYIHTDFERLNPRTAAIPTPIPLGLKLDAIAGRFQVMF
ncbi:MAG: porin [Rhodospirillaceae bacterium]|nr:porin [Rhodospirillaceae bacterium]